jgi:hypothetical protein
MSPVLGGRPRGALEVKASSAFPEALSADLEGAVEEDTLVARRHRGGSTLQLDDGALEVWHREVLPATGGATLARLHDCDGRRESHGSLTLGSVLRLNTPRDAWYAEVNPAGLLARCRRAVLRPLFARAPACVFAAPGQLCSDAGADELDERLVGAVGAGLCLLEYLLRDAELFFAAANDLLGVGERCQPDALLVVKISKPLQLV